jgi:hypothetical protein
LKYQIPFLNFLILLKFFSFFHIQFLQIIGIGRGVPVKYLEGLAEKHDKVAFTYISNPTQETEETLLATLTNDKLVAFINKLD